MARLGCSDFADVTRWALGASKAQVAGLAPVVTSVAADGDGVACRCVDVEANVLVDQVLAVKTRLHLDDQVAVYYHGGLIEGAAAYRVAFVKAAREANLRGPVEPAPAYGHGAVVALGNQPVLFADMADYRFEELAPIRPAAEVKRSASPTEERLAGAPFLDECSASEIVRLMNQQDESVPAAVVAQEGPIAALIDSVARAFAAEGRLIYVGAGTSGRLGVLDASECPPTFGVPPDRVVGLIAGGEKALRQSVEGKEDDAVAALADLYGIEPAISHKDIVVGIAASGTTPYVRVILDEAHRLGITTGLVCCNPGCTDGADVVVAIHTGAEVLTGSTRLKAGTATKLVLNMITTGAMALSGLMYKGLMVGMRPVNAKLRRRAVGIVATLGNVDETVAARLLEEAGYHIATAIIMARKNVDSATARSHLERAGGSLRAVLE